jgi:hypothetical protein
VSKFIVLIFMDLVTPKTGAKHELLFNELATVSSSLNKNTYSAPALGVTKFITFIPMNLVTLCCAA